MSKTRKWLLLSLLEAAGSRGVTTAECMSAGVGSRYSARLLELREAGYTVQSVRERDGSWRYTLLNSPDGEVEQGAGGSQSDGKLSASRKGAGQASAANPDNTSALLSPAQDSLFGIERVKGTLGFGEEERDAA